MQHYSRIRCYMQRLWQKPLKPAGSACGLDDKALDRHGLSLP